MQEFLSVAHLTDRRRRQLSVPPSTNPGLPTYEREAQTAPPSCLTSLPSLIRVLGRLRKRPPFAISGRTAPNLDGLYTKGRVLARVLGPAPRHSSRGASLALTLVEWEPASPGRDVQPRLLSSERSELYIGAYDRLAQ
jgi:hypothetical protein